MHLVFYSPHVYQLTSLSCAVTVTVTYDMTFCDSVTIT